MSTIDPKAAELAKALADAVAAQQTEEYQALAEAAKRKEEIDSAADNAQYALAQHYSPIGNAKPADPERWSSHASVDASIFDTPCEPEPTPWERVQEIERTPTDPAHYTLPTDEDEFADPKPNGGLED